MEKFSLKTIISSTVILVVLPLISMAADLKIRQGEYTYKMSVVQNMTTDTFIIALEESVLKNIKKDKIIALQHNNQKNMNKKNHTNVCRITVHFKFDSFNISPKEARAFAEKIYTCDPDTVFKVTGYTCQIGPEDYNKTLSLQRANTVAAMIKEHGFLTATVQGKGSQNPVADSANEYFKNRRVEIQPE